MPAAATQLLKAEGNSSKEKDSHATGDSIQTDPYLEQTLCGISANISKAVNATDAAAAHNQLLSQATTHNTQYYQKHYTDYPASHKQDDNPADCGVWTDGNANATASHVPFGIMRMQPSHLECIALEMAKELQTLRTTCGILQATVLQQQDEIETLRLEVQLLQDQGELLRDW